MGAYDKAGYSQGGRYPTIDGNTNLKKRMDDFYSYTYPVNVAFQNQAYLDKRFETGDQSLYSMMYADSSYFQSRKLSFNRIKPNVEMLCGYQRKNRKSAKFIPNDNTDVLANQYNKVIRWSEQRDNFQNYFSDAFHDGIVMGETLLHLYPSYIHDVYSGDLLTDVVTPCNYLIDPYWRKQDLSDCQGIWRRRWLSPEQASYLLPSMEKEIRKVKPTGAKDGRFSLQAELLNLQSSNLSTYDEFYYRDTRRATMILDPYSGESVEWEKGDDEENFRIEQFLASQPWMQVKEMYVPTVKLGIVYGNKALYDGENLLSIDSYPYVPLVCFRNPDMQSYSQRQMGIVRNLRDAQFLYNRRKIIELSILESQVTSGWIYPSDAVVDPKALRQTSEGFLIQLKAGHRPDELERIRAPEIPASMIEISRSLAEDIQKICGINEELLGSADDDLAGILALARQSAGLTTLQSILDRADFSMRLYTQLRAEAIRKNFTKGKIQSILKEEVDPLFFSPLILKYSLAVEEGFYSTNQRQSELKQKLYLKSLGLNISDQSILKSSFLEDKEELLQEAQQQQQQQAQQAQQQAQKEEQMQQADIMVKFADARSKMAGAVEKEAGTAERMGEAEYKQAQADLAIVRELMALEDMDIASIEKALTLSKIIKQNTQVEV